MDIYHLATVADISGGISNAAAVFSIVGTIFTMLVALGSILFFMAKLSSQGNETRVRVKELDEQHEKDMESMKGDHERDMAGVTLQIANVRKEIATIAKDTNALAVDLARMDGRVGKSD